ncbi:toll/interleukin-1 receptor domain-containing protein [Neobacillus sp. PS2-9]|uniref:toll/interleukin-1 receptor domain-containing protein n=1 Tax=Neobacillus sp. PS2-9 TaxID=3070676 RepID=UPI0027E0BC2C|nr:toll/interleukin-1 receptor domain-containing protein [Neobacillus sp. PS2-9]WML57768.1 toll/interleukin-1 receptor domain-containing protein [Neobacillus sp. PS2-9]
MKVNIDVFISYSSSEFNNVNAIKNILEKNNISCWMAPHSIPVGCSYANEIPAAIRNCGMFLLMLSSSSQKSQWVQKEVSLALSYGKTVLPFMLENCELTESFNFYLTDVQRYNAYESQSEVLKELIARISRQPTQRIDVKNDSIVIGNQQTVTKADDILLNNEDRDINALGAWLSKKEPFDVDRILAGILTKIRREYQNNPNAQFIKSWLEQHYVDSFKLETFLYTLFKIGIYSNNAAEIDIQVAVIYIHSGERVYTKQARKYLERAVAILSKSPSYDDLKFKKIVYAKWLLAVTYKQERNYGYASDICEELINFINDENKIFEVPFVDALLLPQRELAVINKERVLFDYLMVQTDEIRYNVKELFHTQRRMLEFYILNNDFEKAQKLLPNLLDSFSKCGNHIDAIYQIALYQNLFEYYIYIGEKEKSQHYYKLAYDSAKRNFWKGKQQKLDDIKTIYE